MNKKVFKAGELLKRVRKSSPVVHHITNWVTIYDCANIVKVLGASPVMAHAPEESGQMCSIASSLVLNIGTLTPELIESMKIAAKAANKKGIPVVLDVCGAGATALRDQKSFELLDETKIDVIKGNSSEIARIAGEKVSTRGVDAGEIDKDLVKISRDLSLRRKAVVVVTGKTDIVTDGTVDFFVKNGVPLMSKVVGTGCMASSVIGAFAAVEKDLTKACAGALACFEVASEIASFKSKGPGSFKENLFDAIYLLTPGILNKRQKIIC